MKKVVGVVFVNDGKLLIVKSKRSSLTNSWTLIGGGVEENESEVEAALREICEEFHNGLEVFEEQLIPLMSFKEYAASDPSLEIHMTIFRCSRDVSKEIILPDDEILDYHWYKLGEKDYNLSSSIRDHVIPYAVDEGILY